RAEGAQPATDRGWQRRDQRARPSRTRVPLLRRDACAGGVMRAAQIAARDTERRFPVRIRIGVPPTGLGNQLTQMQDWLDHNAGADGWAMTPSGERGVLNDALSIHLADATIAFVARWCIGYRAEAVDGLY